MKQANAYFGGIPTAPDVERLAKAIAPAYGKQVPYEEIEAVIGCERKSPRFRTVLGAWRKRVLRETNIDSRVLAGQGVEFLQEGERLAERGKDFDRTVRRHRRVYVGVSLVQTELLSDVDRRKQDALRRISHAMLDAGMSGRKEIASLRPTQVNPRATT